MVFVNLALLALVGLIAYLAAAQGLFTALLNLLVTLLAGTLAFALWEPVAGYLLPRQMVLFGMPAAEVAWGVGLLGPFALILLGLRYLVDKLVPGNVDLPYLVNFFAGGFVGFCTGVLTAGVLMIGLQFISQFSPKLWPAEAGTVGPAIEEAAEKLRERGDEWVVHASSHGVIAHNRGGEFVYVPPTEFWLPVDRMAASVYSGLSAGVFYPFSGNALAELHPNLADEATLFNVVGLPSARPGARRTIAPRSADITAAYTTALAEYDKQLPDKLGIQLDNKEQIVVVETEILSNVGSIDPDNVFTAVASQALLLHRPEDDGASEMYAVPPAGYIQRGELSYPSLASPVRSRPQQDETIRWVYVIPSDNVPRQMRLKSTRFELPEMSGLQLVQVNDWLTATKPAFAASDPADPGAPGDDGDSPFFDPMQQQDMGPREGTTAGAEGDMISVSDSLPYTLSRNRLQMNNVRVEDNAIVSGQAQVRYERRQSIGANLAVTKIHTPSNMATVQVNIDKKVAESLFGQAMATAQLTTPPELLAASGDTYQAIGFMRYTNSDFHINLDPTQRVRSLQQTGIQRLRDDETLALIFQVARDTQLLRFRIGRQEQRVNVQVP